MGARVGFDRDFYGPLFCFSVFGSVPRRDIWAGVRRLYPSHRSLDEYKDKTCCMLKTLFICGSETLF